MQLSELIKSLQFLWFSGHIVTILSFVFLTLSGFTNMFYYNTMYIGIVTSFGVQLYQQYFKTAIPLSTSKRVIIRDVNFPYFFMAIIWLFTSYNGLGYQPYLIFSIFHALTFIKTTIIPQFIPNLNKFVPYLNFFLNKYQNSSLVISSYFEIACFLILSLKIVMFFNGGLITLLQFITFSIFIKLRLESSKVLKNSFILTNSKINFFLNNTILQHPNIGFLRIVLNAYSKLSNTLHKIDNNWNLTTILAGPLVEEKSSSKKD